MPSSIYVGKVAELPRESRFSGKYERTGLVMDAANASFVWVQPDVFDSEDPDALAPGHSHAFDQLIYIIEGNLRFWTGDQIHDVGSGDFIYVPANVAHGGRPSDGRPVHLIEFFAPIRTDYLYTAEHQLAYGQAERSADGSRDDTRSLDETARSMGDSTRAAYPGR
jgi:mannose-6-phosphate isomerase-like protein (cupin superfamily)